MNGYRKLMIDHGGNLGWCAPYVSEDGKNAICVNDGRVCGMILNGVELDTNSIDLNRFARQVNPDYSDYDGWSDLHIALDGDISEASCAVCPWFKVCDAMDNPDGWDDTQDAGEYPDD